MQRQRQFDRARLATVTALPLLRSDENCAPHDGNSPRTGEGQAHKVPRLATLTSPLPLSMAEATPSPRRGGGRPRESSLYVSSVYTSATLFAVHIQQTIDESEPGMPRWYLVRLVCRLRPSVSWTVRRRFAHFVSLSRALAVSCSGSDLPVLPSKLMLHTAAEQQRRTAGLQRFCEQCLAEPTLLSAPAVGKVNLT